MESHGGRSLETPRGVAPSEQRTVTPLLSDMPLDVREVGDVSFPQVDANQVPPTAPPRPERPVRVHSRPRMAIVTPPPPQTCMLEPIASSGPIRTMNFVRHSSRPTGAHRRNDFMSDAGAVFSTLPPPSGRFDNSLFPSAPLLSGRSHSASRLQNMNQFPLSLINSGTRSRTGTGSVSTSMDTVSLTLPRPETQRTANEYVETPFRSGLSLMEPKLEPLRREFLLPPFTDIDEEDRDREPDFAMVTLPVTDLFTKTKNGVTTGHRQDKEEVVTSQPSATFKKDRFPSESQCSRQNDDIICSECKRCRCESCRTPRPLPSKWLCGTCHCSADTIVDYATCLCCAKAFFYHCSNDETASYENDPCSCSADMFYARWGCLGIMSVFLPCLFCYWPCRGLVQICESCHQYYNSHGCRCQKLYQQPSPLTLDKRLLDSPE